jgi:hypothetical protein
MSEWAALLGTGGEALPPAVGPLGLEGMRAFCRSSKIAIFPAEAGTVLMKRLSLQKRRWPAMEGVAPIPNWDM